MQQQIKQLLSYWRAMFCTTYLFCGDFLNRTFGNWRHFLVRRMRILWSNLLSGWFYIQWIAISIIADFFFFYIYCISLTQIIFDLFSAISTTVIPSWIPKESLSIILFKQSSVMQYIHAFFASCPGFNCVEPYPEH